MNLDEIKNLIETDGGKFIIIENGKPIMVVTSFEEYKNKLFNKKAGREERPIPKELAEEALGLEDLPL